MTFNFMGHAVIFLSTFEFLLKKNLLLQAEFKEIEIIKDIRK